MRLKAALPFNAKKKKKKKKKKCCAANRRNRLNTGMFAALRLCRFIIPAPGPCTFQSSACAR